MGCEKTVIVKVENHKDTWGHMFTEEAQKIKLIFGDELIDIHHIGSTSVRQLKAKPIIDMMPVVKQINKIDQFNQQMTEIGYEPLGEFGMKDRRYFRKGGNNRTHQIHVFEVNNKKDIDRHLAVRDYLRVHSDMAKQYGELKERLASQFPNDIVAYMDGKDLFMKELEQKALNWFLN